MKRSLGIALCLCVLSGCTAVPPAPQQSPSPESPPPASPQWPDDFYERAEEAAVAVVAGYLEASDRVTQAGGVDPAPMYNWVSPAWLHKELEGFSHFVTKQERTVGASFADTPVVQLARYTPEQVFDIGVMMCVDTRAVLVIPQAAEDPPAEVLTWHPHYDEFTGTDAEWAVIEDYFGAVPVRLGDRRTIVFWLMGETLDRLVVDSSEEWWGVNQCFQ